MKEKDNVKCKEWERRRREKLNDAFKNLSQLLPNYDPAKNIAKIDVLEKSTEFVKELRLSNSRLLSQRAETDEKCKLIKELQDEVNKLILRVKQLTTLLRVAKIAIPMGPHIKSLGKRKLKWSDKIGPENLENSTKSINNIETNIASKEAGEKSSIPSSGESNTVNNNSTILQLIQPTPPVPLKETNLETLSSGQDSPILTSSSNPTHTININSTSPIKIPNIIPSGNDSTATPLQLPMQTIYLTSCPVTPVINQNPQMMTRISLCPTRILPKPMDGVLRKIAILRIRKPLPLKEKKRRNRKKKLPVTTAEVEVQTKSTAEVASENVEVTIDKGMKESNIQLSNEPEVSVVSLDKTSESREDAIVLDLNQSKEKDSIINSPTTDDMTNKAQVMNITPTQEQIQVSKLIEQDVIETPMEIDLVDEVAQEVEISSTPLQECDQSPQVVICKEKSKVQIPNVPTEEIITNKGSSETNMEPKTTLLDISSSNSKNPQQNKDQIERKEKIFSIENSLEKEKVGESTLSKPFELKAIYASDIERNIESSEVERISTQNQDTNSSISDTVSGEKISECIARSIDLIDAPDGELMELADNWGDSSVQLGSPKSPISPTQMFLNMFPLLPRESIVSVSEGSQQGNVGKSNFQYRSSFYIDAMLPDDPPGPVPVPGTSSITIDPSTISSSVTSSLTVMNNVTSIPIVSTQSSSSTSFLSLTNTIVSSSQNTKTTTALSIATQSPAKTTICTSINQKQGSQKANQVDNSKASSSSTRAKVSEIETRENTKTNPATIVPSSLLNDLNLYPETIDFGNFHHISSLTEDLFREVTRIRNVPDCQHASASVGTPSTFQQLDFGSQFQFQQPKPSQFTHSIENQFVLGDIPGNNIDTNVSNPSGRISTLKSSSNSTHLNRLHEQVQPSVIVQNTQPNPLYPNQPNQSQTQTQKAGTYLYDTGFNSRFHQSQSYQQEPMILPKQPPNHSQTNKYQLFRPQVADFHQTPADSIHPAASNSQITHTTVSQSSNPKSLSLVQTHQSKQVGSGVQQAQIGRDSQKSVAQKSRTTNSISSSNQTKVNQSQNIMTPVQNVQTYRTVPTVMSQGLNPIQTQHQNRQQQSHNYQSNAQEDKNQNQTRNFSNNPQQKISEQSKSYQKSQRSKSSESVGRKTNTTTCQNRRSNQITQDNTLSNISSQSGIQIRHEDLSIQQLSSSVIPIPHQSLHIPSFPDFSLSSNFHQAYESFNHHPSSYPISGNNSHQPQHQQQQQQQVQSQPTHPLPHSNPLNPQQQHQRKTTSQGQSRQTPFYLQDVNPTCDSYSFTNPSNIQTHQHQPLIEGTNYNSTASHSKSHYSHNQSSTNPNIPNSFVQPTSHVQSHNYFANPPLYQGSCPHQNSPSSSSRNHVSENPPSGIIYNVNANRSNPSIIPNPSNQHHQQNISQTKSKPSTSTISSQHQVNQTNYSSTNPSNVSSSVSSSRPAVNWMTDTSNRPNKSSNVSDIVSSNSQPNPFSVSKLVGNSSVQNANNSNNNASVKPNAVATASNAARCTNNNLNPPNPNNSYCAESLIRKNPSSSSSWNNLNFPQLQTINQHPQISHQPNSNPQCPSYEISSNDNFNFSGYQTTNFPQHSTSSYNNLNVGGRSSNLNSSGQGSNFGIPFNHESNQQQQQQQQSPHNVHSIPPNQYHHHFIPSHNNPSNPHSSQQLVHHQQQGTTSSVSNFNLSSIFPEINDKRGGGINPANPTNSTNNTGSGNSSENVNCNYYAVSK